MNTCIETSLGELRATVYDDGCAKGIQIKLNDQIIAAIDVLNNSGSIPGEARALVYSKKESDEPTDCFHIEV